jgi:hypothetical protein
MRLSDILLHVRKILDDDVGQESEYLWEDWELVEYANDAIEKLCKRCHLIEDSATINEKLSAGTVTLNGLSGSVDMISVDGVDIMSAAVPFSTDIATTASNVAANINAYSSTPNYTATSTAGIITISAVSGTGSTPNGYEVAADTSGMTASCTNMAGGDSLTQLYLIPGKKKYELNSTVLAVIRAETTLSSRPLERKTIEAMDKIWTDWKNADDGTPFYYVPNMKMSTITIVPAPSENTVCNLIVSRLPITELSESRPNASPEIASKYHRNLFNWILHRAYSKHDTDTYDDKKAAEYFVKFNVDVEEINIGDINGTGDGNCLIPGAAFI